MASLWHLKHAFARMDRSNPFSRRAPDGTRDSRVETLLDSNPTSIKRPCFSSGLIAFLPTISGLKWHFPQMRFLSVLLSAVIAGGLKAAGFSMWRETLSWQRRTHTTVQGAQRSLEKLRERFSAMTHTQTDDMLRTVPVRAFRAISGFTAAREQPMRTESSMKEQRKVSKMSADISFFTVI